MNKGQLDKEAFTEEFVSLAAEGCRILAWRGQGQEPDEMPGCPPAGWAGKRNLGSPTWAPLDHGAPQALSDANGRYKTPARPTVHPPEMKTVAFGSLQLPARVHARQLMSIR